MAIELGLNRISRLVQPTSQKWRAIHVAGTNGKGSICAYASAMLHAAGIRSGRFTSPHLIDRWDCITIDEKVVDESLFRQVEDSVRWRDRKHGIRASNFEILTATAFEIFTQENVEVSVVEVGLGGRLDATNVLVNPFATVISKIGLDHQSFLGNSLAEIAREKAGIMKSGVPCIVDATNDPAVMDVLESSAASVSRMPLIKVSPEHQGPLWDPVQKEVLPGHQRINLACAVTALQTGMKEAHPEINFQDYISAASHIRNPARLQRVSIEQITGRWEAVLIDGAHNLQSAEVLASVVQQDRRDGGQAVTWIVAVSAGKDVGGLMRVLIHPSDNVIAAEFGPVDGMPWVKAVSAREILDEVDRIRHREGMSVAVSADIEGALRRGSEVAGEGPLVIAGSLYLAGDVLRLLRNSGGLQLHRCKPIPQ